MLYRYEGGAGCMRMYERKVVGSMKGRLGGGCCKVVTLGMDTLGVVAV